MSAHLRTHHPAITHSPLAGCRVLVLEADALVSMVIADILTDQQSIMIGPFTQLQPALSAASFSHLDFALLDVSPRGVNVRQVAEALTLRQVPFLLLSSFGTEVLPADRPEWRVCSKPFSGSVLVRKMVKELNEFPRNQA